VDWQVEQVSGLQLHCFSWEIYFYLIGQSGLFTFRSSVKRERERERLQMRPVSQCVARAITANAVAVRLMQSVGPTPTGNEPRPPQRGDDVRP
jgi:hypothetical protein